MVATGKVEAFSDFELLNLGEVVVVAPGKVQAKAHRRKMTVQPLETGCQHWWTKSGCGLSLPEGKAAPANIVQVTHSAATLLDVRLQHTGVAGCGRSAFLLIFGCHESPLEVRIIKQLFASGKKFRHQIFVTGKRSGFEDGGGEEHVLLGHGKGAGDVLHRVSDLETEIPQGIE